MVSISKVINLNSNKNFCRRQRQNPFLIVLISLLMIFSNVIFASTFTDDEDQLLNQTATDFKEQQAKAQKTQEPNVLKHPVLVGGLKTDGSALGVAIIGDYAYVADYDRGLNIINIVT